MANRVLVLGPTGKIGEHLVKLLHAQGVQVSALARDVAKAQALFPGVTVIQGDTNDLQTVKAALAKGFDRIFILTNTYTNEGAIARAAKEAGVKQCVKISCWLANRDEEPGSFFSHHGNAEDDVAKSGLPWVFLRPADFMQNLLSSANGIKHMGKLFHAHGNAQIGSIDARDIAACAAAILTADPAAHNYRAYTLTGSEARSWPELAAVISKIIGKQVDAVDVGDAGLKQALIQHAKLPEIVSHLIVQLSIVYRRALVGNRWTTGNVEIITGKKPRTFEAFIEENKAQFV